MSVHVLNEDGSETEIIHLRYGVLVKKYRYIIARQDASEDVLVISREWVDHDDYKTGMRMADNYTLYKPDALAPDKADEILENLKEGNEKEARAILMANLKRDKENMVCSGVGPVVLDDMIADRWYDAWKEMEGYITSFEHMKGYYEADVEADIV